MDYDDKKDGGDNHLTESAGIRIVDPRFPLGFLEVAPSARRALSNEDIRQALQRHVWGDWGIVCEAYRFANERSLQDGFRLDSAYVARNGTLFWVNTEWDRSVTRVLLQEMI